MLQNARITGFAVSELLRENQQWVEAKFPPTQIRVKSRSFCRLSLPKKT